MLAVIFNQNPTTLKKSEFENHLNCLNRCYSDIILNKLPKTKDFPKALFTTDKINFDELKSFSDQQENVYIKSVVNRFIAVYEIQNSRKYSTTLDIKSVWKLISESITILPDESVISSIGSQGFLSIPLYKYDEEIENFDFIRLHIWDNSLNEFIDQDIVSKFSIHTHSFLAKSWIISGTVINERYRVEHTNNSNSENSLFQIKYDKTLDNINKHSSTAVNSGINIFINKLSYEEHFPNSTYSIYAGEYHKSKTLGKDGLAATFFSFTTQGEKPSQSYVTGPKNLKESAINRKMYIDPTYLIEKLNKIIL